MLINVFRIIRKSQVGEFDQGWSQTLQESGSREPDLSITDLVAYLIRRPNYFVNDWSQPGIMHLHDKGIELAIELWTTEANAL